MLGIRTSPATIPVKIHEVGVTQLTHNHGVKGYGSHLVAFLQYGVAACPCVLQEGSYDGHERESL